MPADPHILVDLTSARNEFEAAAIAAALEDRGIPASTTALSGIALGWEVAGSLPFRVQVPRACLDAARETHRAIRAESIDIDWSEVETGDESPRRPDEHRASSGAREAAHFRWWHIAAFIFVAIAGTLALLDLAF